MMSTKCKIAHQCQGISVNQHPLFNETQPNQRTLLNYMFDLHISVGKTMLKWPVV